MAMYDVFISYAREDKPQVKRLADAFTAARGWSVWWDQRLRSGERFPREIQDAVTHSRCVLVVWSPRSVDSDWVCAEATEGWQRGILVPLQVEDCEPPLPFRQTETADFSDWNGAETSPLFLKLLEDIQRVHSQGVAASSQELQEREARRRGHHRRRLLRRWLAVALVALTAALGWYGYRAYSQKQATAQMVERLASRADELRQQVLTTDEDQKSRKWWALLMQDDKRLERLELSVLLAAEAMKRSPTPHAERSLRNGLALLPWSDKNFPIDFENIVSDLAFSYDGRLLAAGGGKDGTLVWDLVTGEITARISHGGTGGRTEWQDKRGNHVNFRGRQVLDFSPNQPILATAGPDNTVRLWEATTGRELHRLEHAAPVNAVRFAPDGNLVSTTELGTVHVWDSQSGLEVRRLPQDDAAYTIAVSTSGKFVASASLDKSARVWELATGRQVVRLRPEGMIEGMRFDPNEAELVTFGGDTVTTVWELKSGAKLWQLPVSSDGDAGAVFAPNGQVLVIGDTDGKLSWWDIRKKTELYSSAAGSFIRVLASSPNGKYLTTIDADETARVWEFEGGREIKRLPYLRYLTAMAVSPDSRFMATCGDDGWDRRLVELTEIWPADPVAKACSQLSRNLTREEWREYLGNEPYRDTCPDIAGTDSSQELPARR
jgi:WD40 repeat protein